MNISHRRKPTHIEIISICYSFHRDSVFLGTIYQRRLVFEICLDDKHSRNFHLKTIPDWESIIFRYEFYSNISLITGNAQAMKVFIILDYDLPEEDRSTSFPHCGDMTLVLRA